MGSSSTAAPLPLRAPTSRPTAPGSTTTTSPRAPAWRPGTSPPPPDGGGTRLAGVQDGGRWMATPTSGGSPATTSRPARRRVGCATDEHGLRFVEVVVNGPKTWSLAAALHPEIAAAYDAAQDRAAAEIIGWLAEHATTRVGPRGRQVQVPVEQLEAAVVRHYTSRAGDPHRHLHLQINARVFAAGGWRGLHSVGVVDSIEAINGIGHAAVMCDPEFRAALARTATPSTPRPARSPSSRRTPGRSAPAPPRSTATSTATKPRGAASIPTRSPARRLRRAWDRRAWAEARPDKVVPRDGADLAAVGRGAARARFHSPPPSDGGRARSGDRPGQPRRGGRPRAHPARRPRPRGTPPTSAARSRSIVASPTSSPRRRYAASWPRTSPPAPSTVRAAAGP